MSLGAPSFWYDHRARLLPALLSPAAALYSTAGALRRSLATPRQAPVPIICVGNLVAGGAGKTPTCLALAKLLRTAGAKPALLSRGHGGRLRGPIQVDPTQHTAREVGDEPLLLAAAAPTWIARDRHAGAIAAAAQGATVIVMDDGYQNPTIAKDFSMLVIDGPAGFGNGRVHPAGPLREPIDTGLARADAVVIIGPDKHGIASGLSNGLPVFSARIAPRQDSTISRHQRVLAFAGIGRPEKFFQSLEDLGCTIVARHAFTDHHNYTPDEIMRLVEHAAARQAIPVTTEKDAIRLPPEARAMVQSLPIELVWNETSQLRTILADLF